MTSKERLKRAARGMEVDCIPTIGGWIGGARNLAELGGLSLEEYLADPLRGVVKAYLALGVDAIVPPVVPRSAEQVRTGHVLDEKFSGVEPRALVELANSLPDTEREALRDFDAAAEERRFRSFFERAFSDWDGIEPMPNFWEIGGHFPLYTQFGYTAFLIACAEYPEAVGKIWWARAVRSRERAKILVGLYREFDLVPLMFCGEDLCNNQGPMVSPAFLRRHYLPTVQLIIEPLVDAGIRLIHHCDGDVRPLLNDFIAIGFSGFQGFQYECGIDLYELRRLRSRLGEEPVLFAGMSVSRTLPFGDADDVQAEIDFFVDATDGGRGLFLHTSNVTGVEVPADNVRCGYTYAHSLRLPVRRERRYERWAWSERHPENP